MRDTLTDRTISADTFELAEVLVSLSNAAGSVQATLGFAPIRVGTDPSNELVSIDPRVSRHHLELALVHQGVRVRDLESKNGTWVNHVRIEQAIVTEGQSVGLGSSTITFSVAKPRRVPLARTHQFGRALGASIAMRALFAQLERVAVTDVPVLLLGESGTGKEVLAEAIHTTSSRRDQPFVVFDCGSASPTLLESALFGHRQGAFTGAAHDREGLFVEASGGTLFIDEIGELPLELQPKLLRALETKRIRAVGASHDEPVDVRIVAATHADLKQHIATKAFREDLYHRLAGVEVTVPPLRDRRTDIPLLVEHLLSHLEPPRSLAAIAPHTMAMLQAHAWPGNVRELRNVVSRLILFGDTSADAPSPRNQGSSSHLREARDEVLHHFEKTFIARHLAATDDNVSEAARRMGVSRQFLHRLMVKYGLRGD